MKRTLRLMTAIGIAGGIALTAPAASADTVPPVTASSSSDVCVAISPIFGHCMDSPAPLIRDLLKRVP